MKTADSSNPSGQSLENARSPMSPADEALCRVCGGSGRDPERRVCEACGGTGKVIVGIGGG